MKKVGVVMLILFSFTVHGMNKKRVEVPTVWLAGSYEGSASNLTIEDIIQRLKVYRLKPDDKQYVPCIKSTSNGCAHLIEAVQWGCKNHVAEFILSKKEQLNDPDKGFGNTPLHWATYFADWKMALLLLENGAKHDLKNKKGLIPLTCYLNCVDNSMTSPFADAAEQDQLYTFFALARGESKEKIKGIIEKCQEAREK
jgi:hypothetical protein